MILNIGLIIISYLIGSVLFGVILSKVFKGVDIRDKDNPGGSGSIRQFGWTFGITVGILDALKGVLVAYMVQKFTTDSYTMILCAVAVVAGHSWPILFGFRGGGGLAPAFGISFFKFPIELLISVIPAILSLALYKHTSLPKYLPFVGPAPIMSTFALLSIFILVLSRYGFFPHALLIIAMGLTLIARGYGMYLRDKRKKMKMKDISQ